MNNKNQAKIHLLALFVIICAAMAAVYAVGKISFPPHADAADAGTEREAVLQHFGTAGEDSEKMKKDTENNTTIILPDSGLLSALKSGSPDEIDSATLMQYQNMNSDVKGIIRLRGTVLNHPLMQSFGEEGFYLYHNVLKEYSNNGTPFMTRDSDLFREGGNTICYGHNIRFGRKDVFEPLSGYEKIEFYREHPLIEIVTEKGIKEYLVFAYYLIDTADEDAFVYWKNTSWTTEEEFVAYMAEVERRNWLDCGVSYQYGDNFLTLSSCSVELAHSGTNRMVVMGRLRYDKEAVEVYTESVKLKENPYLPKKLRNEVP